MPPSPSDATPRPPADFAPVLATEKPLLLVGGQAVNLWALYYRDRTAELAPFVSHDADVLGDRDTLAMLGKLAGAKPQFFPLRPPSNEVGVVVAKDTAGQPMLIEVLRYVHGVDDKDAFHPPAPPAFLNVCEFFQNLTGIYSTKRVPAMTNGGMAPTATRMAR